MQKQYRILLADDEDSLRMVLAADLESNGYYVHAASDGNGAIEFLKHGSYDLALLDVRMPFATGIDVLKYIHSQHIKMKVLMLTSLDDLNVAMEAHHLGADGYLLKPFNIDEIRDRVAETLGDE